MLYTRRLLPLLLRTVVTGLLVPVIVDILWGCSKWIAARRFFGIILHDRCPNTLTRKNTPFRAGVFFGFLAADSAQKSPQLCAAGPDCQKSPSRTTCAYGWDTYREICRGECARPQGRVRGSAANFVPRGILGTAELSRCLRQKQAKRSRSRGLSFARALRRPLQKAGNRNQWNFCRAYARRNGFPLKPKLRP